MEISWLISLLILSVSIQPKLEKLIQEGEVKGVAALSYHEGKSELIFLGVSDLGTAIGEETPFKIASITKLFTADELALLANRKRVTLNDSLGSYLPAFKSSSITLQSLATHTSGLPRTPEQSLRKKGYLYSNWGYQLLGDALEKGAALPFEKLIARDILTPMGMQETRFIDDHRFPASGGLLSTPKDMLKYLKANLGEEVSNELYDALLLTQRPFYKVNAYLTMGLGWQRFQKDELLIIDKNGALPGYSSYIGIAPEKKAGIVLLTSGGNAHLTAIGREFLSSQANEERGGKKRQE